MRHHSQFAAEGSAPPAGIVEETVVFPIHSMYEVVGGTAKIIARWVMLRDCRPPRGRARLAG
jgi:hypothetical protein